MKVLLSKMQTFIAKLEQQSELRTAAIQIEIKELHEHVKLIMIFGLVLCVLSSEMKDTIKGDYICRKKNSTS